MIRPEKNRFMQIKIFIGLGMAILGLEGCASSHPVDSLGYNLEKQDTPIARQCNYEYFG